MKRRKRSLSRKIVTLISSILLIIFAALITLSLTFTRSSILSTTNHDLSATAQVNGLQVQEFMHICQSTALSLHTLMEDAFAKEAALNQTGTVMSEVYPGLMLSSEKKELESQMIATARNAVRHNSSIIGIGKSYPSTGTQVVSGQGTIAYDSLASDHIGMNITELSYDSQGGQQLASILSTSKQAFYITHRDADGGSSCSFFYPLTAGNENWQTITSVGVEDIKRSSTVTTAIPAEGGKVCSIRSALAYKSSLRKYISTPSATNSKPHSFRFGITPVIVSPLNPN